MGFLRDWICGVTRHAQVQNVFWRQKTVAQTPRLVAWILCMFRTVSVYLIGARSGAGLTAGEVSVSESQTYGIRYRRPYWTTPDMRRVLSTGPCAQFCKALFAVKPRYKVEPCFLFFFFFGCACASTTLSSKLNGTTK